MKLLYKRTGFQRALSLPVRGAWIEIALFQRVDSAVKVSLPVRGAWIEIQENNRAGKQSRSLPVRGAWIEIKIGLL